VAVSLRHARRVSYAWKVKHIRYRTAMLSTSFSMSNLFLNRKCRYYARHPQA